MRIIIDPQQSNMRGPFVLLLPPLLILFVCVGGDGNTATCSPNDLLKEVRAWDQPRGPNRPCGSSERTSSQRRAETLIAVARARVAKFTDQIACFSHGPGCTACVRCGLWHTPRRRRNRRRRGTTNDDDGDDDDLAAAEHAGLHSGHILRERKSSAELARVTAHS